MSGDGILRAYGKAIPYNRKETMGFLGWDLWEEHAFLTFIWGDEKFLWDLKGLEHGESMG